MKGIQRIIAFILTFALFISGNGITNVVLAKEINNQKTATSIGNDGVIVEGTNSFGSLLSNTLKTELDE